MVWTVEQRGCRQWNRYVLNAEFLEVAVVMTETHEDVYVSMYYSATCAIVALIMVLYPVSGLIANVCCGRLKTVMLSLLVVGVFFIVLLIAIVLS